MIEKLTVTTRWPQLQTGKGTALTKGFIGSTKLQASLMILKQLASPPLNVQWTALGHFDLGQGMMWWASPCQASASDWETLSYEEATLPGFWLPGQRNPSASQYHAEWFSTTQVPQTPAVGPMLSSKCGSSVSSALGRKTVWSYSYFLHRRMSIKCNTLLSQSASCQSSHRSQSSVQE